jgi:hypothetical protein
MGHGTSPFENVVKPVVSLYLASKDFGSPARYLYFSATASQLTTFHQAAM